MNDQGLVSPADHRVVAAVLVAIVFTFFGQLYFLYFLGAAIVVLGLVMLFTRSKTPTD